MATKLSKNSIGRAIDHLVRYGDTDVFPHLIELIFLKEMKDEIIDEIAGLNLDNFNPSQAIETIAPKSRFGFRIVHQLLLLETLLYTSALVEIGNDLEQTKRPIGEFGPFAYRFDSREGTSLFLADHTFRDWLEWQKDRANKRNYSYVIFTDIADFYQRIYSHRIENSLDSATANKGIKRFVEKLIKQIRSKQSYGIPVGGTASRLIAEAVLSDSDNALAAEEIEFSRFVDDFRIFVRPDQSPYSILAFLADQLAAGEGLALNAYKTKLFTIEEFRDFTEEELGDALDEAEKQAIEVLTHSVYFDEDEPSEDDIATLRAANLFDMLESEFGKEIWDFGKIKALFRALRLVPDAGSVAYIAEMFSSILPFTKELVLYLDELNKSEDIDTSPLREKALAEMQSGAASSVPTIRVWLLELFIRGVIKISLKELNELGFSETLDNRQKYIIRGLMDDVNYFRREKARFEERNNFEKFPFMLGATCLPADEFENWIGAIRPNLTRPLDKLFCDWVKGKQGSLEKLINDRVQ